MPSFSLSVTRQTRACPSGISPSRLAQIRGCSVLKRLEPLYLCLCRKVLAVGRNHLSLYIIKLLKRVEGHRKVVVGDDDVLYTSYLQARTRVHIYIILLVLAQSVEGVQLSVGYDITLAHSRVDVDQLYGVVLIASVGAIGWQIDLQRMGIVGYRHDVELLPILGSLVQLHSLLGHVYSAVGLIGKVAECIRRTCRWLHCIDGYGCQVGASVKGIRAYRRNVRRQQQVGHCHIPEGRTRHYTCTTRTRDVYCRRIGELSQRIIVA